MVTGAALDRLLKPYFSRLQLTRLVDLAAGGSAEPTRDNCSGALLFLDVIGFTALTERLQAVGPAGAEQLSEVLDAYFGAAIDELRARGGDVLFFAGDAVLVMWPVRDDSGLDEASFHAATAALAVQHRVAAVDPPHGAQLEFRASLAAGTLNVFNLGGVEGHWLQFVSGDPLSELRATDEKAVAGQVACDASFARRLGAPFESADLGGGYARLRSSVPGDELPGPEVLADSVPLRPVAREDVQGATVEEAGVLTAAIPKVVRERLAAGQAEFLAEFRQVTMVFTNLAAPGGEIPDLETLQTAVSMLQTTVAKFDGTVYQLLEDDKGVGALIAFGLPGSSHDDDAARAVRVSNQVAAALRELGLEPSLGIATGRLFCGVLGTDKRRNYSLLGSTMNRAARIMQAESETGLLCDDATRAAVGRSADFEEGGQIALKGFEGPLTLWTPVAGDGVKRSRGSGSSHVVGRSEELGRLQAALDRTATGEQAPVVVIDGDAGVGKSTLLDAFLDQAEADGFTCWRGEADAVEIGTPHYVFRPIAREWFGIPPGSSVPDAREAVQTALAATDEFADLAPLLNGILGLDFPETEFTEQLRGQVRAENLNRLLTHFAATRSTGPTILCLEDCHWIDSASWGLLAELRPLLPRTCFVLTSRPMDEPPVEMTELLDEPETEHLQLAAFSGAETGELIAHALDVAEVRPDVTEFVAARTEGNPLFVEELVRSLVDTGHLEIGGGRCAWAESGHADRAEAFPSTLEGVFTARLDRLDPEAQLTLKVASVIGRSFEAELVNQVHPPRGDRTRVIEELLRTNLIEVEPGEGLSGYRFRHALGRDAVYGLLPFARRTGLHRTVAEALEDMHSDNPRQVQARLGRHFKLGALPERAIPYLAGAADDALDGFANREAIGFYEEALELDLEVRGALDRDSQRARWHRKAATGWYSLNELDRAREGLLQALDCVSSIDPGALRTQASVLPKLAASRLRSTLGVTPKTTGSEETLEILRSLRELCSVLLWQGDSGRWAVAATAAAGLAPRAGVCGEAAEAIAQFAALCTPFGLHRSADRGTERSFSMALEIGELDPIAATGVVRAMVLTSLGEHEDALPPARRAEEAAHRLRASLSLHRSQFASAEPLFWLGQYEEAESQFRLCAESAIDAEPHAAGMARSLQGLASIRRGDIEGGLDAIEAPDGIALIRQTAVVHSRICALGALAEARRLQEDAAGVVEAALEAEGAFLPGDDATLSFSSAMFGHGGIAEGLVEVASQHPDGLEVDGSVVDVEALLARFVKRVRTLARHHRGTRGRAHLVGGLDAIRRGKGRRARQLLEKAVVASERSAMPYELGRSLAAFATIAEPDRRDELRARALEVFELHGLVLERDRVAAG